MRGQYKILIVISAILVLVSAGLIVGWGLPLGVDFNGGSVLEVEYISARPTRDQIVQKISDLQFVSESSIQLTQDRGILIRSNNLNEIQHQAVIQALSSLGEIQENRFDSIGPTIGQELRVKSITALIVVFIAITIYIAIVFRRLGAVLSPWILGASALVALAHDLIITGGVFAALGHFQGIELNSVFVAAALTILGYSVSDTVVIFDRIRENVLRFGASNFGELVHQSVIQTLSRSINTSVTTLLPLIAIFFFGGESIRHFALALIVGVSLGTYSSIFVAAPLVAWWSASAPLRRDKSAS
ncbi:MAG: protein translocase subunit SecF [Candidatus Yanofskybacteria bacterium CG10_big_fil_rev_8_21_14_0_10_46_23]|uniref:Protein-export membrane protein SecF n=1 Tax=Candidatus Yanofskybacteria bacterium CG10_big_fil_rev_8_21_14_0_10_46_23 TaxID=1975098 RepID=A0A2H0R4D7_9BACT|nr:MAG: protein translocase subunit SecF [Candidatus Yanofskybacteria bacterium CG10_big_fil_rev_8_21_14_0_10_46_23]